MITDAQTLIIDFNFSPASYIDESWLQEVDHGNAAISLLHSGSSVKMVSKFILRSFNLSDDFDLDFSYYIKELALLDRSVLAKIVYHAGLLLNAPMLKSIIQREKRQALISCVSESTYFFLVKKAPFLAGELPSIFPCEFVIDWSNLAELKKHFFRSGVRLLGLIFASESDAYKKRLLFKFPSASKEYFENHNISSMNEEVSRQSKIMLRKLMKEFVS